MRKIRPASRRVTVRNSGLVGFLYDAAETQRIARSGAGLLEGYGESPVDEGLVRLSADRLLLAFEIQQDDDLVVELSIGDDLTIAERATAPWLAGPAHALLSLPSGKLRIETYDTLRARDEPPDSRGGSRQIAPGDYAVSVYRPDVLHEDCPDDPQHVVVLTPVESARSVEAQVAWLPFLPAEKPERRKRSATTAGEGRWTGNVADPGWNVTTDLDIADGAALGLRFGQVLKVNIGKRRFEAIFIDNLSPNDYVHTYGRARLDERPGLRLAWWSRDMDPEDRLLVFGEDRSWKFRKGTKVQVTCTDVFLEAGDDELLQDWRQDGDTLVGRVLHRARELVDGLMPLDDFVILNFPVEQLTGPVGTRDPAPRPLALEIGGSIRELHLCFEPGDEDRLMKQLSQPWTDEQREAIDLANDRWLFERDPRKKAALLEEWKRLHVPPGMTRVPYVGKPVEHWTSADRRLLRVVPGISMAPLDLRAARGDEVRVVIPS